MKSFSSFFTILVLACIFLFFSTNTLNAQKKATQGLSSPSKVSSSHDKVSLQLMTGRNVNYVEFGRNGKALGFYKYVGEQTWTEVSTAKGGLNYKLEETKRDQWSVHLQDLSRNTFIQIDLKNKKILFAATASQTKRPLYDILNSDVKVPNDISQPEGKPSLELVNGENVTLVNFGRNNSKLGFYIQVGKKAWKEIGTAEGAGSFEFKEMNRDEWSVYLKDEGRSVSIQLDLHTKKVFYKDAKNLQKRPLYEILNSSAKVNGWMVQEVTFENNGGAKGKFIQKDGKGWVEVDLISGQTKFNFIEQNRDDWSVYLFDKSRNAHVQLDLHTSLVMFGSGNQKKYPIYKIVDAKSEKTVTPIGKPTPPIIPASTPEAFSHTTNSTNTTGNSTWLNHSKTNNNSQAIVFVTPNWKSPYNPTSIGVYWDKDKWRIFNQDRSKSIPENYRFNVLAYPHTGRNVFVHKASKDNTSSIEKHITRISHPYCDGDKNAQLIVTQNYGSNGKGVYNNHPIGVYYANGQWSIFNQDRAPMPENAQFNVLILKKDEDAGLKGAKVMGHKVSSESLLKNYTHVSIMDSPQTNGNSELLLFATSSWNTRVYNKHNTGVYYHSGKWSVYNCDKEPLSPNAYFNILAIDNSIRENTQVAPPIDNSKQQYNGSKINPKTKINN